MRAWQIHGFGGTDQLRLSHTVKVPPLLGPKDVLIEVHAASVNPVDLQMLGEFTLYIHADACSGHTVPYTDAW